MKKLYLALSVLFVILTFTGAGYVLANHGKPGSGYAVVPMAAALAFNALYQNERKKDSDK